MIRGVNHVGVSCTDLDRAIAFYRDALGFVPVEDADAEIDWRDDDGVDRLLDIPGSAGRSVILNAGNVFIELIEFADPATPDRDLMAIGFNHICLEVDDVDATMDRMRRTGATFHAEPTVWPSGATVVYGKDPDGNALELISPAPQQAWTIRSEGAE